MRKKFLTLLFAMFGKRVTEVWGENSFNMRFRHAMSSRLRCFLMVIGTLMIITVAAADPVSCPGTRCVPMLTGNWLFLWGRYYPSFEAAMAAQQAAFEKGYAPCTITMSLNNEFPALEAMTVPNGTSGTTGDDWWSIWQTEGSKYDIRWASAGTFSTSGGSGCDGLTNQSIGDMVVQRSYKCPAGYNFYADGCFLASATSLQPDKSRKPGCKCSSPSQSVVRPSTADPVDIAEGFMWEKAEDISSTNGSTLERNYNSQASVMNNAEGWPAEAFGSGWRSNYSRHVRYSANDTMVGAYVERVDGQIIYFGKNSSTGVWSSDPDIHSTLTELDAADGSIRGWVYFDEDTRDTETYNNYGNLIRIVRMGGSALALAYDTDNNLLSVTDDWGRGLVFNYTTSGGASTGQVQSITDSTGSVWEYFYDSSTHVLKSVIEPDGSSVTYHYEDSNYPRLITGEGTAPMAGAESRFSWVTYDSNQRVQQVYNAGNADQAAFTYGASGSVVVTNQISPSSARTRNYAFNVVQGMSKLASVSGDCDVQCGPQATSLNANGDLIGTVDFNGAATQYSYSPDGTGLEVQRIEAFGTSTQRKIQTDWNEALRLPTERRMLDANDNLVSRESWVYNVLNKVHVHCEMDPAIPAAASYACLDTGTPPAGVRRWIYHYCGSVDTTQCPIVGLLLTVDGPRNDVSDVTTYAYYMLDGVNHHHGDLASVTDPLGHVVNYLVYDGAGRITAMQDVSGVYHDFTYTPRGWLATHTIRVTPDNGPSSSDATTTFHHTAYGSIDSITDADGVVAHFGYDDAHRLTDITDALGKRIHYTLDGAGNKTKEETFTAGGTAVRSLSRTYNPLRQLTAVMDGLNHTVFNAGYSDSYDANGNLQHSADGLAVESHLAYDPLNRLIATVGNYNGSDPNTSNSTSAVHFDALDRPDGITDPDGLNTYPGYDGLSNRTSLQSPDTGTSTDTFDAAGNRLTHTDAKGIVSTSTYDAINRLLSTSYTDSSLNVSYHYDQANTVTGCSSSRPVGRLTRMVENGVTTTFCYGGHGVVNQQRQTFGSFTDVTQYTYTPATRLSGITLPDLTQITYAYNTNGMVTGVQVVPNGNTTASPTVASAINWMPFGPMSTYTLGNGQTVARAYDANYRLTDLTSPALNLHFAHDVMGDISAIGNAPGASPATESYHYDPLYRFKDVTEASGSVLESYTYDKTGDRTNKTATGLATGAYLYSSGTHRLGSISGVAQASDANGNTTGRVLGANTFGFSYSGRNRLALAQLNGSTVATYTYNAMGQRIGKVATLPSSTTERYSYDLTGHLIGEYGTTNRDYVWLGDTPVAVIDNTKVGSVTTSVVNYITADQLGTPRAVSNAAGTVIWQWAYQGNPFGEQQPTSTSGYVLNLRYPGQYYDVETGLVYNGARYFDPPIGRFDQPDPSGIDGGIDLYVYGNNNPLTYIDPLGLCGSDPEPETGRYEACNQTQNPSSWSITNKFKMSLCKKSIDATCNASHDATTCCEADYHGCTGGKALGEPPSDPKEAMKMGQCMVKFTQCMSSGGKGSE